MLLIDGVKYQEWINLRETEDLEPMVIEHSKEIFGENTEYFDIKKRLESSFGRNRIPDGYVVDFNIPVRWHVVENELSNHPIDTHIREQVNDFITATEKIISNNRHKIVDEIFTVIDNNHQLRYKIEQLIKSQEIHKFLTDLILYSAPSLTIIIEKKTEYLEEELKASLRYSPMNIVEFRTFRREDAGTVHIHIFEPLYESSKQLDDKKYVSVETNKQGMNDEGKKVTMSDFVHQTNGIYMLESNKSVIINVRKHHRLVEEQLAKYGLWTQNLGSFCWYLRKKAGLLNTPPED